MKLVFPGGEHPQVLLSPGISRIGSDPQANIVLDQPGVLPLHCELHVNGHGVMLQVPRGTPVRVNGRAVDGLISLRPGDNVNFDCILARLAGLDAKVAGSRQAGPLPAPANDDPAATAVRPVLPRFVLQGLSGVSFGRSHAILGPTSVGRSPECNLRLNETGLSRQHARLIPTNDGLQLEDLGSTNGCYINGHRVQHGLVKPGDEIAFDITRFRLAMPGQAPAARQAPRRSHGLWRTAAAVIAVVVLFGLVALLR